MAREWFRKIAATALAFCLLTQELLAAVGALSPMRPAQMLARPMAARPSLESRPEPVAPRRDLGVGRALSSAARGGLRSLLNGGRGVLYAVAGLGAAAARAGRKLGAGLVTVRGAVESFASHANTLIASAEAPVAESAPRPAAEPVALPAPWSRETVNHLTLPTMEVRDVVALPAPWAEEKAPEPAPAPEAKKEDPRIDRSPEKPTLKRIGGLDLSEEAGGFKTLSWNEERTELVPVGEVPVVPGIPWVEGELDPAEFRAKVAKAKAVQKHDYGELLRANPGAKVYHGNAPLPKTGNAAWMDKRADVHTVIETEDGETYYTNSPLVLDLNGDGVRMSDKPARFDADGDGVIDVITDVSHKDGLLVFDADGDGAAGENARELLGDKTDLDGDGKPDGFADGFEALAALAGKAGADGDLDAGELGALAATRGLRLRLGGVRGRVVTLAEAGVTSVHLSAAASRKVKDFDGQGNDVTRRDGAWFARADGTRGAYEDVWFKTAKGGFQKLAASWRWEKAPAAGRLRAR